MGIREEISQSAAALGIYECGFTDAKDIGVSPMVRTLCEKNACGAYGKSWACPPGVGTIEECAEKLHSYTTAFVFSTRHELEDSYDFEGMMAGKDAHAAVEPGIYLMLREKLGDDLLILSTEGCKRCKKCTYPDAPCRFPESLHPSIESHGVEVNVLAESCGIRYHNGKNTVTYHTCVF
ncbi:MAG: DUF2284 domain-containing protein, partial [Clostridia bacterium]|nr:DUF2284 domain-containing protein [Clostridia bacterium]